MKGNFQQIIFKRRIFTSSGCTKLSFEIIEKIGERNYNLNIIEISRKFNTNMYFF